MRKFLIPLLMAGVVLPASAYAKERGDLVGAFRERAAEARKDKSAEDRPQRAERAARAERPERVERSEQPARAEHVERAERPNRVERTEQPRRIERAERIERQRPVETQPVQQVRRSRSDGSLVDGFREVARRQQSGTDVRTDRPSTEHRDRTSDRRHRWSNDWRRDHRYDWHSYRNNHRSLFRIGRYYDPYGWGYRRFSIGFNLWPSYYGSSFWLNDPWQYRLPPAYGPYRWVRYYDDALLVNIYDGQVVDVLYNFFW